MSSETVQVRDFLKLTEYSIMVGLMPRWSTHDMLTASLMHTASDMLPQPEGVLLKGPWLILGESHPDVSTMKQSKTYYLPFHKFSYISDS